MDDGVPYKVIIRKLGPAGQHLNEDNLSNWRLGGYQDHLKAHAINERAQIQTQAAAEIVRESGTPDPARLQQVCSQIALLQYIDTIAELGEQCARESLKRNPAKFITLLNACCNMSNANIALEKHRLAQVPANVPRADAPNAPTTPAAPEPIRP